MFSELRNILLPVQVPEGFFCISLSRDAVFLGGYQVFLVKNHQSKKTQ